MGLGLSRLLLSCGHALTSRTRARTFLCPNEAWNVNDGWAATQRNSGLHLHTHCHRNPTSRRISILLPRMTFDFCKKSRSQAPVCDGWVVSFPFKPLRLRFPPFSFAKLRTQLNIPQNARVLLIFAPSRYRHTRATANWLDGVLNWTRTRTAIGPKQASQTMQYRQPAP
ncbi:hypothetical protein BC827DRAFT_1233835 [Russula dissimulans]|nr:hypothetical protein BC827DRAFT_1233835 [Russula dissimulans]